MFSVVKYVNSKEVETKFREIGWRVLSFKGKCAMLEAINKEAFEAAKAKGLLPEYNN